MDRSSAPSEKLKLFATPLAKKTPYLENGHDEQYRDQNDSEPSVHDGQLPRLKRHKEPTLLEVFYDLFFAGVYNVFSSTQKVTNVETFKASIGFFCLLWLTWLMVTFYDVRFATDSIFARITRAIQLGVLLGFVVIAPRFDPGEAPATTITSMALIIMFSRLCLVVEYASTLWSLRQYRQVRKAFYVHMAAHGASSIALIIVAIVANRVNSRHMIAAVYAVAGVEAVVVLLLGNLWETMSLSETHLMTRLTLLTVMILGEGIQEVAQGVASIVPHQRAWDSRTIGQLTAVATAIYFIFLVYFDWLRSPSRRLPPIRQQAWTVLHLPFHLALVIFMQGFTQLLVWSKIASLVPLASSLADPSDLVISHTNVTSAQVASEVRRRAQDWFRDYPPTIDTTWQTVDGALANVTALPDSLWPYFRNFTLEGQTAAEWSDGVYNQVASLVEALAVVGSAMLNSLFAAFGINLTGEVMNQGADRNVEDTKKGWDLQLRVQEHNWDRYFLVFAYTYAAAGITILMMTILTVVSRTTRYRTWWPRIRIAINSCLAVGTGLVALLWYNDTLGLEYLYSPWVIPTITLVWTVILVITHINGEGIQRWTRHKE